MEIEVRARDERMQVDGIVTPYWMAEEGKALSLPDYCAHTLDAQEFKAAAGQMTLLRLPPSVGAPARCVLLLGMGDAEKINPQAVAGYFASAFNALKGARCAKIALDLAPLGQSQSLPLMPLLAAKIAAQIVMADYSFDKYKPLDKDESRPSVERVVLLATSDDIGATRPLVARAVLIGAAANLTRSWQNEPANVASPAWMAVQAKAAASKRKNLTLRVMGRAEMEKEKMGALLAVASGSAQEPKMVVIEYRGAPQKKGWDAAIVGKGVTFDSGGISIKPASKMDEMKFDKSGACASIGIMMGCADLKLPLNIVGVAALVENMPSGQAYRPGDIVTACDGTTIEVLNTDAEGRVVLADALAWTSKKYEPAAIVDLATLTGAVGVALGDVATGLLGNDEKLSAELISAGERCGERAWILPLWPEYDEKVKSEVAAIKNIGEPGMAGPMSGASFLKKFVGERAWAHLDIAATAYGAKPRAGMCAGGYGTGVRLVLEYLSAKAQEKKK